jgi:hypothetical protein
MHKIINRIRCICNPYIRFGNQIAILRGRSSKNHKHLWQPDIQTFGITLRHQCFHYNAHMYLYVDAIDACDSLMNAP